jgi:betaine-aldehyde dehydrogenase
MSAANGHHYIAGSWVHEGSSGTRESINPATGNPVGKALLGSARLADEAIQAARYAFETTNWASDPRLRARVLLEFADRLQARQSEIARLMAQENGKILGQAMHEVAAGFGEARYYAGLARNVFGRTFESGPGKMSMLTREASGVVSVIVPWNAPVTLLVRSVAPALAAGCTIVIKPAPQTPLTNAMVMQCFDEVEGLPKGVVNSVNECGVEVGTALSTHPEIDVISFTGSSRTGKLIMANAAETVKHVSLELGGKAPAVVFDDAELDKAIAEITRSALALNGQMCTSISRVLVQDSVYDEVSKRLKATFETTQIGDPLDKDTGLGPLIDRDNQNRVLDLIDRAGDEADLILRGTAPAGKLASGAYVTPSIFSTDDVIHPLVQQELFGPIVSLERFSDETEALTKSNATRFGLAASVFTNDLKRAMRMARKLKFGTVWLNSHNRLLAEAETGGYRESGNGRLHGVEAMNDFLETKHIYYEAED